MTYVGWIMLGYPPKFDRMRLIYGVLHWRVSLVWIWSVILSYVYYIGIICWNSWYSQEIGYNPCDIYRIHLRKNSDNIEFVEMHGTIVKNFEVNIKSEHHRDPNCHGTSPWGWNVGDGNDRKLILSHILNNENLNKATIWRHREKAIQYISA